jgi:DNA-directed RNA polymerase I, II, and III subunit RPABC2
MSNNNEEGLAEVKVEENEQNDNEENSNQILEHFDEIEDFKQTYSNMVSTKNRKTIPFLTKYEKARIIGKRAMQISKGAPPLVEVGNLENPVDIALKELKERKIPYIIRRPLPNGVIEDWRVEELRFE